MLRKVNLPPAPGEAQLPDPLTQCHADVLCHPIMVGLALALYLAHTLFRSRKALDGDTNGILSHGGGCHVLRMSAVDTSLAERKV